MAKVNKAILSLIKHLEEDNLVITDRNRLVHYIKNYNFNCVIKPYAKFLKDKKGLFHSETTSDDIINLYDFDVDVSSKILKHLLLIERKLNTVIAYAMIKEHNLPQGCLFKLTKDRLKKEMFTNLNVNYTTGFEQLINKLVRYCHVNSKTSHYENSSKNNPYLKWQNCPLDVMCLSWSLSTTVWVFNSVNRQLKNKIIKQFNVEQYLLPQFSTFVDNLLFIRNVISHNDVLFDIEFIKRDELVLLKKSLFFGANSEFKILDFVKLVDYFNEKNQSLEKEILVSFKKLKVSQHIKEMFWNIIIGGEYGSSENN